MSWILQKRVWIPLLIMSILIIAWIGISLYIRDQAPKLTFETAKSKDLDYGQGYGQTFIPGPDNKKIELIVVPKNDSRDVIVYFHGNVGRLPKIIQEAREVATVVSPAYPGYSYSEGEPTSQNVLETATTVIDYLISQGIGQNRIIVLGHSMGGAPAVFAATKYPDLKKVVLVNTFYSMQAMCETRYSIFCIFGGDFLNTAKMAPDIKANVVHIHNKNDEFIPYSQGERLHKLLGNNNSSKPLHDISGNHAEFPVKEALEKE